MSFPLSILRCRQPLSFDLPCLNFRDNHDFVDSRCARCGSNSPADDMLSFPRPVVFAALRTHALWPGKRLAAVLVILLGVVTPILTLVSTSSAF